MRAPLVCATFIIRGADAGIDTTSAQHCDAQIAPTKATHPCAGLLRPAEAAFALLLRPARIAD
jgi:hypothetical protein